jgi:hypothetical protein
VKAAGHLVALAAELSAGVELGQDDGQRREALLGHDVNRDSRAPVPHRDGVVRVEDYLDAVVATGERLVDGVVDDLEDEMMEAARPSRPDVHPRSLANRLEAFQNCDVLSAIALLRH